MNGNNKDTWLALEIAVSPEAAEAVEFALNSVNALGTAISFRRVNQTEALTVTGYFNELPDDQILQDELHYALRSYDFDEEAIYSVKRETIENTDWLAEWKKHWKPTTIGRFVIAPPWEEVDAPDKIVIRIEPNMAFGTGTHETTQLCLSEVDKQFRTGESFLDVGTGTGILAIAAAKIGVGDIFACDTDADSIKIARENAGANGAERIKFETASISQETPVHDFVCANLTIDVILPILNLLMSKTRRMLVMSGILSDQEPNIVSALKERGVGGRIERLGEWISVTVRR